MNKVRLLPIVIMAIAALLVLKSLGLVTNGGYVLTGVTTAEAAGGGAAPSAPATATAGGGTVTMPSEPTLADTTPTLADGAPTVGTNIAAASSHGSPAAPAEHGASVEASTDAAPSEHGAEVTNTIAAANECDPRPVQPETTDNAADGQLMVIAPDCPPMTDALPQLMTSEGPVTLGTGGNTATEQVLLERLATRRTELESYEQQLSMRASLVEAAEKRIEERQATMQSIEDQIASLVEQRKQMEEGQFAAIVAMYETMKPKDAANIFNNLDIEVLLRVSKMMSPRKMAPILAAMNTTRAQELTVRLASAEADPLETMTPDDLAALPQIVGQ